MGHFSSDDSFLLIINQSYLTQSRNYLVVWIFLHSLATSIRNVALPLFNLEPPR